MVKVQVMVSGIATDVSGKVEKFRRGQIFDCPVSRIAGLGTSIKILEPVTVGLPEVAGTVVDAVVSGSLGGGGSPINTNWLSGVEDTGGSGDSGGGGTEPDGGTGGESTPAAKKRG